MLTKPQGNYLGNKAINFKVPYKMYYKTKMRPTIPLKIRCFYFVKAKIYNRNKITFIALYTTNNMINIV